MTRNPDANIARTAEAWRVDFHNAEAWEVVVSVVPGDRCHDGAADITTDEARAIRDAMTARGLVCVCDASLVYGDDDHGYTSQDVHEAATRGEDAFWEAVAASFPGITTGDLPVNVAHDLSTAMRHAIVEWVRANA